jgi:uncharacterized damage-inducible protein DinB
VSESVHYKEVAFIQRLNSIRESVHYREVAFIQRLKESPLQERYLYSILGKVSESVKVTFIQRLFRG